MSEQKPLEPLTVLSITEKQRDFLAAQFHNLERDKALLLQAIALKDAAISDLSKQLVAAEGRAKFLAERLAVVTGEDRVNEIPAEVFKAKPVLVPVAEDADSAA